MAYPFEQLGVELSDRIDEVIHGVLGLPTEVVNFWFMGRYTTFGAIPGHIGLLKVQWPLLLTWFNFNPVMDK